MSYEKNKRVFDRMVETAIQETRKQGKKENREAIERKVTKITQKTQK